MHVNFKLYLSFFVFLVTGIHLSAQYGPLSGSTYVGVNHDNSNWDTEYNAYAQNDAYCEITGSQLDNQASDKVRIKGFGFSIPASETITGVVVEMDRSIASGSCQDNNIQLLNTSGVEVGTNLSEGDAWAPFDLDVYTSFGGSTNTWGLSLTPTDINDPDFGVSFQVLATSNNAKPRVDHIRITVYTTTALPVEFTKIYTSNSLGERTLHWETASETNSDYFQIQASEDAINWEVLGETAAAGFSTSLIKYNYQLTNDISSNLNYLRIKQVDFDNTFSFSKIIKTQIPAEENTILFPSVSTNTFYINTLQNSSAFVYDYSGKLIQELKLESGINIFGSNLKPGNYLLNVNASTTIRFTKK